MKLIQTLIAFAILVIAFPIGWLWEAICAGFIAGSACFSEHAIDLVNKNEEQKRKIQNAVLHFSKNLAPKP